MARTLLLSLLLAVATPGQAARDDTPRYAQRADVRAFAQDVAARRGLDADWVLEALAQARLRSAAQKLMMPAPAGQAKNWFAYRDRFIEPRRILAGVEFWRLHADALERAEARWGVPAQVIVGIIGVETFFGRVMGNFRVLDALTTLAFDFPGGRSDRSAFFREELEEFLVYAKREGLAPTSLTGSFAGAIGWPQFMPGSINRHAVDFDGDGHIDLLNNPVDAIGSVAHFLAQHGWQRDQPVAYPATPPADAARRATLLAPDIVPSFSAAQFEQQGAALPEGARAHAGPLALVMVENGGAAPSYFAGTQNFYVLTRYNRSSYYALAVLQLGEAVQRSR